MKQNLELLLLGLALLLGSSLVAPVAKADHDLAFTIDCGSHQYQFKACPVGAFIRTARLVRQTSHSRCEYLRTWGFDQTNVWVDRGCGGIFEIYPD